MFGIIEFLVNQVNLAVYTILSFVYLAAAAGREIYSRLTLVPGTGEPASISSSGSEAHRAVAEKSKGGKTNKEINNFYNRMGLIREKMLRREVSAYRVGGMEVGPQSFCYWERSGVKES